MGKRAHYILSEIEKNQKSGHWIDDCNETNRWIRCSNCGSSYKVSLDVDYDDWITGRNYCEVCGADMRKEKNNDNT